MKYASRILIVLFLAFAFCGLALSFPGPQRQSAAQAQSSQTVVNHIPATSGPSMLLSEADSLMLKWSSGEPEATYSVAWGDWDNDGDLDLAAGGEPNRVYSNVDGALTLMWTAPITDSTRSVAWGDYDNDGDLDLAIGNSGHNRIYCNTGGALTPAWSSTEADNTRSVAWGDSDGDGDLDLAVGNDGQPNRIYRNDGTAGNDFVLTLAWSAPVAETTNSIAWGDVTGDGKLDLMVGNWFEPNRLYRNDGVAGVTPTLALAWSATDAGVIGGECTVSVVWGDVEGDGDLDLAVGNWSHPNRLYRNDGMIGLAPILIPVWSSAESSTTSSLAWGDWDSDGDLDLAVGNSDGEPNWVYRNDTTAEAITPTLALAWSAPMEAQTLSVAWGDGDGDGDLDLALGNINQPDQLYANNTSPFALAWSSPESKFALTTGVAWGDYDSDGDLDLAVGNLGYEQLYRNDDTLGDSPSFTLTSLFTQFDESWSIAWGDADADGDLDLAVGNVDSTAPDRLYINRSGIFATGVISSAYENAPTINLGWGDFDADGALDLSTANPGYLHHNDGLVGGGTLLTPTFSLATTLNTGFGISSMAWGDADADGDLDLAVGSSQGPVQVYTNYDGIFTLTWTAPRWSFTSSIAWGDADADGDLDLAVGNTGGHPNRVYRNDGGAFYSAWISLGIGNTTSIAWGDYDGDGDLDLAVGNHEQSNRVYRNDSIPGSALALTLSWSSPELDDTRSVAWGDYDNDGDLDLAVGNYTQPNRVYRNGLFGFHGLENNPPTVSVSRPDGTANAAFFSTPVLLEQLTIPITYTLADRESDPVRFVRAYYSPDGGGMWYPATVVDGTLTQNLTTSPTGHEYSYVWDVFASGFFGRSDNVVFRIEAYPTLTATVGGTPGPYQYAYTSAATFPFRVRGTQVRVYSETVTLSNTVAGAMVYRLPNAQTMAATPIADGAGRPWQTDAQGYLQGRGQVAPGDQLIALLPVTATDVYTLYHTSATPTLTGLAAYTVTAPGMQVLTVTSANTLILFNLDISLEWDARRDVPFLERLDYDLRRASELLYDWSNGQVALGAVHIYHGREHWDTAAVRIYASNRMRPSAIQGGVTRSRIEDPDNAALFYEPGQVRLGASWSRFGEAGSSLAEDWPRALAHELGHYLLYLDDNYLGFDAAGTLIPVDSCSGAMADPYRGDFPYDEFHAADAAWSTDCSATLSQQRTARSDWATVSTFYPLRFSLNAGPAALPLAVTQVHWHTPVTPTAALADPTFYLMADGARLQPGMRARAFLFQEAGLTDLGSPRLDRVLARGAGVGDRLCVLQPDARQVGCEVIGATDRQLELVTYADWQPDIIITPITSRTLHISVTQVSPSLDLQARLYSESGEVTSPETLTLVGATYQGTFTTTKPTIAGYVQVWDGVLGLEVPRREAITDFALGGNPAPGSGAWSGAPGSGAWSGTPTLSSDGQVSLYSRELVFPEGEFYALQATTALPQPPAWATIVGQAYRLLASGGAPPLSAASISFQYLGSEVPAGEESWLAIYTWDGSAWDKLPTRLDLDYNTAAAPVAGPGLYVLMASLEIPLPEAGWNLFAYPVQATRPVTEALLSIQEVYTTVYGYEGGSWLIYDKTLPPLLNTLHGLEFGRGYWISVTQPITLNLKGGAPGTLMAPLSPLPQPPASFYGPVVGGPGFAPEVGTAVRAWSGGEVCGQGSLQEFEGQLVYLVHVEEACAGPGAQLRFQIGDRWMITTTSWSTAGVKALPLRSAYQLFLPLVGKME